MDDKLKEQLASIAGLDQSTAAFTYWGAGLASMYKGMIDGGMPVESAQLAVNIGMSELMKAIGQITYASAMRGANNGSV